MSRGPLAESCARLELPSYFTFLANEYEMFWWIFDERTVTVESLTVFIAFVVGCNRKFLERIEFRDFFSAFNWIFLYETAEPIIISRVSLAFKKHLKAVPRYRASYGLLLTEGRTPAWALLICSPFCLECRLEPNKQNVISTSGYSPSMKITFIVKREIYWFMVMPHAMIASLWYAFPLWTFLVSCRVQGHQWNWKSHNFLND